MEAPGLKCSSARERFKSIPNATRNGTIDAQLSNGALLITAVKKKSDVDRAGKRETRKGKGDREGKWVAWTSY